MSGPRDAERRWWRLGLAAVLATALLAAVLPPVQARAKAAVVLAEAVELPAPRPFAPDIRPAATTLGGVAGELYHPGGTAPPVVLLPGATPAGLRDERVVRTAQAYARAGRAVFIPELALYEQRFDEADIDRLVRAGVALADRPDTRGDLVLTGFSYGGSLALVAAAEPPLKERLAAVGVFGAYYDFAGVVQAATTGVTFVDGEAHLWEPHPSAEDVLVEQALALAPTEERPLLKAVLRGGADPAGLPPAVRPLYDLVTHTDPGTTEALIARLPTDVQRLLERFSPASVADELDVPVIALHDVDDPAVPYAEALRLKAALPDVHLHTVELFDHVDFRPQRPGEVWPVVRDLVRTWRFAGALLAAHEAVLPVRWRRGADAADAAARLALGVPDP